MIRKNLRVIALGSVTLFIGLVALFPARLAYQWFDPAGITLSAIDGTIWTGRAEHADVSGVYARDLRWRFKPLAVFTGKAAYSVETSLAPGNVAGDIAFGLGGSLTLTDVSGSVPLQTFERAANMPGLQGRLSVQIDRIVIDDGLPVAADGEIEVSQLVAPMIHRGSIGGYKVEFFTQDAGVMASVEDTDGLVDLAGNVQIARDRNYTFHGLVAPKPATPGNLRQQMQFLGTANERGQYELRLEGSL